MAHDAGTTYETTGHENTAGVRRNIPPPQDQDKLKIKTRSRQDHHATHRHPLTHLHTHAQTHAQSNIQPTVRFIYVLDTSVNHYECMIEALYLNRVIRRKEGCITIYS